MFGLLSNMSARSWRRQARWTVFGTLACIAVSVTYNWIAFRNFGEAATRQGLLSATVLPILLAGPLFFYLTLKLRELAIANHKLEVMASTDSLTMCLNRGAFSTLVDAWLSETREPDWRSTGALLVIDADHFKRINDRYGHDQGDEALRIIAHSIRSALRKGDLVGRLGGEEFGVFLPGATEASAADVAERIRTIVNEASFRPGGDTCELSVSVGCAAFEDRVGFSKLFRIADERLYEAKHSGRNRVMVARIADHNNAARAAAMLH